MLEISVATIRSKSRSLKINNPKLSMLQITPRYMILRVPIQ